MRFRLLIAVLAVVAASCGGTGESTDPAPTEAPNATTAPAAGATTTTSGATGATPTTEAPPSQRPATEGPAAPAINTILSDGTAFSLADEANPVYLVFWAEW